MTNILPVIWLGFLSFHLFIRLHFFKPDCILKFRKYTVTHILCKALWDFEFKREKNFDFDSMT